jgi:nucleoside-diphosphate-sugar epimerase
LEHFFGPGDDPSKFVTAVIQALLRKVPSIDFTPGYQKRDFIFIDDVSAAFKVIFDNMPSFEKRLYRFEVGTGRPVEIRKFVHLAKRLTGNTTTILNFGAIPYRSNEAMCSKVNIKGLKDLGWSPGFSLEAGLKKTIEHERMMLACDT